jgi:SAM-dependent methyltransferase
MGYVFDFTDSISFDRWLNEPRNRFAAEMETRLLVEMLDPRQGESVLDIGCGTGVNLRTFLEMGLQVTGLDPSPYMLDIALRNVGKRVDFYRGFAEDLPFDDNSFNHACLVTTLEFVADPLKAIAEASRVAKDRIYIGVFNRYAIKSIQRRLQGIFTRTIFNQARFFSIWELKQMIRDILGDVPISWRSICQLPSASGNLSCKLEQSHLLQKTPFGAFVGMTVTLVPRFRTRPLAIKHHPKGLIHPIAG